ncbi:MAG TPA: NAD(P)/FAD-dependent oxidoreductase, partial [Dermatophilaceae bacterium]
SPGSATSSGTIFGWKRDDGRRRYTRRVGKAVSATGQLILAGWHAGCHSSIVERVDVAIVGGGPAGLSAAVMLGRCCRRVVVIDAGDQRNRKALALHGFLSRDGIGPADLLRAARADIEQYPTVELRAGRVAEITGARGTFKVRTEDGATVEARRVLLATGVTDVVPKIAGIAELFGRSVHHCPHCDAYEYAGKPVGVYGHGTAGREAALAILAWTDDVVLLTDGHTVAARDRERLEAQGIAVRTERIARFTGRDGQLDRVEFATGRPLRRTGLFLATGQREQCGLAEELGCELTPAGVVKTEDHQSTRVPGVYVAGDASTGEQMVVVAAAEGTMAAVKIHASLWEEDLRHRRAARQRRSNRSPQGSARQP